MNRWVARIALLISIGMVAIILGGWGAVGSPLFSLPMIQQTSASPSPSESECELDPLPPPVCPEPEPSESGSPSASPSETDDPDPGPGRQRHKSSINIKFNDDRSKFSGRVNSVARCERNREVLLRRNREGRDPIVGRDDTNRKGKWGIRLPGADGRFYAQVLRRSFVQGETRVICRGARSQSIRV